MRNTNPNVYEELLRLRKGDICEIIALLYMYEHADNPGFIEENPKHLSIRALLLNMCMARLTHLETLSGDEIATGVKKILLILTDVVESEGLDINSLN